MKHASIIMHLYSHFSRYHELWRRKVHETDELGALVFLPGRELQWEWWSMAEIRDYIQQGGLDDRELLAGLTESEIGEEFFVLVIEHATGPQGQEAHFHRMNKAKMN